MSLKFFDEQTINRPDYLVMHDCVPEALAISVIQTLIARNPRVVQPPLPPTRWADGQEHKTQFGAMFTGSKSYTDALAGRADATLTRAVTDAWASLADPGLYLGYLKLRRDDVQMNGVTDMIVDVARIRMSGEIPTPALRIVGEESPGVVEPILRQIMSLLPTSVFLPNFWGAFPGGEPDGSSGLLRAEAAASEARRFAAAPRGTASVDDAGITTFANAMADFISTWHYYKIVKLIAPTNTSDEKEAGTSAAGFASRAILDVIRLLSLRAFSYLDVLLPSARFWAMVATSPQAQVRYAQEASSAQVDDLNDMCQKTLAIPMSPLLAMSSGMTGFGSAATRWAPKSPTLAVPANYWPEVAAFWTKDDATFRENMFAIERRLRQMLRARTEANVRNVEALYFAVAGCVVPPAPPQYHLFGAPSAIHSDGALLTSSTKLRDLFVAPVYLPVQVGADPIFWNGERSLLALAPISNDVIRTASADMSAAGATNAAVWGEVVTSTVGMFEGRGDPVPLRLPFPVEPEMARELLDYRADRKTLNMILPFGAYRGEMDAKFLTATVANLALVTGLSIAQVTSALLTASGTPGGTIASRQAGGHLNDAVNSPAAIPLFYSGRTSKPWLQYIPVPFAGATKMQPILQARLEYSPIWVAFSARRDFENPVTSIPMEALGSEALGMLPQ